MQQARQQAAEFRFTYGYEVPVDYLAKVLADKAQVYTQVRTIRRSHSSSNTRDQMCSDLV